MSLRRGHGRGKGAPRIEVLPPDELPAASGSASAPPERDASGRFLPGNRVGTRSRARVGSLGGAGLEGADAEVAVFLRWGRRYSSHRRTELARAHGGEISAGVGALLESAGQQLAASRYVQSRAAKSGDPELFKKASALANDARQNELAAWELAAREASARPAGSAINRIREALLGSPAPSAGSTSKSASEGNLDRAAAQAEPTDGAAPTDGATDDDHAIEGGDR